MINNLVKMDRTKRVALLFMGFIASFVLMPFVDGLWFIFFILGFVFLALLIYTNMKYEELHLNDGDKSLKNTLTKNNIHLDDYYIGDNQLSAIGINQEENKIVVLNRVSIKDDFTIATLPYSKIIESSLIEDDEVLVKSSKSGMVGGALIGGVFAGGVGATIGGLSASKTMSENAKKLKLSIVIDDISSPIHQVNFLDLDNSINKDHPVYQDIYNNANKWHKRISVILKRNEQLNTKTV